MRHTRRMIKLAITMVAFFGAMTLSVVTPCGAETFGMPMGDEAPDSALNGPASSTPESKAKTQKEASPPPAPLAPAMQNYSGLADLVTMICDDALGRFQSFYGPTHVRVDPFTTMGTFEKNKLSELGMTLADQMVAKINNDIRSNPGLAVGATNQKLQGVLQEIDGYLRIHISGVNAAGEWASYVVNVEMSEPIYRALHTYL